MRIATLLITTLSLFDIFSEAAEPSLIIQKRAEVTYDSWIIAENHNSLPDSESKITLFQQLNLTTAQQKKIERIHRRYYPQIIKLRETLTSLKEELTVMMAGTESATTIRDKHQEVLSLRQELGELQLESMLATREVLTLEQRQNFADILRSRK